MKSLRVGYHFATESTATFRAMARPGEDRTVTRSRSGRLLPTRPGLRPTLPAPTAPPVPGLAAPTVQVSDLVSGQPSDPQYSVTHETIVEGAEAEVLWNLYEAAMAPLDEVAAMKHLDSREQIFKVFAQPGIIKVIGWSGDEPVGLGLVTKDLSLVPEASPAFFLNQFPEHAARDRIFYGMAVLVKPTQRGMTMFSRIYIEMWQIPAKEGGVLIFDTCKFNRDNFGADGIIEHIASNFPQSNCSIIDQQTWYAAELPEPLR